MNWINSSQPLEYNNNRNSSYHAYHQENETFVEKECFCPPASHEYQQHSFSSSFSFSHHHHNYQQQYPYPPQDSLFFSPEPTASSSNHEEMNGQQVSKGIRDDGNVHDAVVIHDDDDNNNGNDDDHSALNTSSCLRSNYSPVVLQVMMM